MYCRGILCEDGYVCGGYFGNIGIFGHSQSLIGRPYSVDINRLIKLLFPKPPTIPVQSHAKIPIRNIGNLTCGNLGPINLILLSARNTFLRGHKTEEDIGLAGSRNRVVEVDVAVLDVGGYWFVQLQGLVGAQCQMEKEDKERES